MPHGFMTPRSPRANSVVCQERVERGRPLFSGANLGTQYCSITAAMGLLLFHSFVPVVSEGLFESDVTSQMEAHDALWVHEPGSGATAFFLE